MAAHALTLLRHMLGYLDRSDIDWGQIKHGFGYAPGIDDMLGYREPEGARYDQMLTYIDAKDTEKLRAALRAWVAILEPVQRHFRSTEEYNAAKWAYVRLGKPYWRRRSDAWRDGRAPMPSEDRAPHYSNPEALP